MAGVTLLVRAKERWNILKRYSFLTTIYWSGLLVALGYLLYHDYGIYQTKRDSSTNEKTAQTKNLPRAILIGFPGCGAGSVAEHLELHTGIAYNENFNFFHNDARYKRGLEYLRTRDIPTSAWDAIGVERANEYVYHEKAAERIKHMNSSVRILVGVCDPVKRAVSEYRHFAIQKLKNNETYDSLKKIILNSNKTINEDHTWIDRGMYNYYIKMWLKYFPLKQFHFINGPDFKKSPLDILRKVEDFLGLEPQLTAIKLEDYRIWKAEQSTATVTKLHVEVDELLIDMMYNYYQPHNNKFFKTINQTYTWE